MRPLQIVVVAYHAAEDLRGCLDAIGARYPVTLVDNSQSRAIEAVAREAGARYMDAGANLGFAAGVNLALAELAGREPTDVLLLNPDSRIAGADIAELQRFMHAVGNDHVAAASPALHDNDGNPQRVVWPFPTPLRGILEAVGLGKFGHKRSFVIGATLLLRWEAIQEVGSFDERFFLYAEETDWQRRCQQVGWSSVLCPDVTGFHAGAGTSDDPARREALFHAGQETYIRKWYGRSGWWIYRGAVAAGAVARFIVLRGERRRSAARRAVLYVRGPRRAAGVS